MITTIKTLADVQAFTKQLVAAGTVVHPDNDFSDYVNHENNQPTYTAEEAARLNALMDECFAVAEKEGFDVYEEMLRVTLTETNLNQFIPLP